MIAKRTSVILMLVARLLLAALAPTCGRGMPAALAQERYCAFQPWPTRDLESIP
jgi:hypothetical protein